MVPSSMWLRSRCGGQWSGPGSVDCRRPRRKCATRQRRIRPGPESRAPAVIPIPRVTIVSSGPEMMVLLLLSWHHDDDHHSMVMMVHPVAVVVDGGGGEHDIHGTEMAWSDGSSPWRCRRMMIDQSSSSSSSSCRARISPPDHHDHQDCSSSSSFVETRRTKSS